MVIKLLVIADDFTGALDTGVQFTACGAVTRVVTRVWDGYDSLASSVQVLVIDAETRHLSKAEAYKVVYDIAENALKYDIPYIYKKTDSALRGNVGSELKALKDAAGVKILPFVPAFPQMGRITKHGIHFINGKPVRESVFGRDPFEPVECSYIPDIIHRQTDTAVVVAEKGWEETSLRNDADAIVVFDAVEYDDILTIANQLRQMGMMKVIAGCAGFAASLPHLLGLNGDVIHIPEFDPGLLVICGSVNPITGKQLDAAEKAGFIRIRLQPEQKLMRDFWKSKEGICYLDEISEKFSNNKFCIIDTNDKPGISETIDYAGLHGFTLEEARKSIANTLGKLLKELMGKGIKKTMLITGGDTLLGFMEYMGIYEMEPIYEMAPGTVLSAFRIEETSYQVISKSGGFGDEDLLIRLAEKIEKRRKRYDNPI